MKYILTVLIMALISSCVHSERIGGKRSQLWPHKSEGKIVQMELSFTDMNSMLAFCTITLFRENKDWSLCYIEYNPNDLNHHRHIELTSSEGEDVFQNSMALFIKPSDSDDRGYSLSVSMTLSDYVPVINEYDQIEIEVWDYHLDVEGNPEWDAFLKHFRNEFIEFDLLLNEITNYKHKQKPAGSLFPEDEQ